MSGKDDQGNPPLTDFPLHEKTIEALLGRGITHLFPIQALTFQKIYNGNDVIGRARTGCGKTLGFALPVIERLRNDQRVIDKARGRAPVCLVMCPTRELARQVAKEFESVSPWLSHTCIYGGASYEPQKSAMWRGLDIVVGTPGRIIDHIERGTLKLDQLSYFILDEARPKCLIWVLKKKSKRSWMPYHGQGSVRYKRYCLAPHYHHGCTKQHKNT